MVAGITISAIVTVEASAGSKISTTFGPVTHRYQQRYLGTGVVIGPYNLFLFKEDIEECEFALD